MRQVDRAL